MLIISEKIRYSVNKDIILVLITIINCSLSLKEHMIRCLFSLDQYDYITLSFRKFLSLLNVYF